MYDLDAIEAINIDQIATVTDRLLLGAVYRRRQLARGSAPDLERTMYVRAPRFDWIVYALVIAIASAACAIACLLA
jgi:hypothetical protein